MTAMLHTARPGCDTMDPMKQTCTHYTEDDFAEMTLTREQVLARRDADGGPQAENSRPQHIEHVGAQTALLHLAVLGSGSKGNCAIIDGPKGAIMVDAGFSKRETLRRMEQIGFDSARIKAIIVTHEHSDHIGGLGVVARGLSVPVYASCGTAAYPRFAKLSPDTITLHARDEISLAGIDVTTFPTSHDANDPIGMRFSYHGDEGIDAIGYVTDTGVLSPEGVEILTNVRVLALESNHDPEMLRYGPYPYPLKVRIAGDHGHLSNEQSAAALDALLCNRLETVVGMHLSETNNEHRLPVTCLTDAVTRASHPAHVVAAWQVRPTIVE